MDINIVFEWSGTENLKETLKVRLSQVDWDFKTSSSKSASSEFYFWVIFGSLS